MSTANSFTTFFTIEFNSYNHQTGRQHRIVIRLPDPLTDDRRPLTVGKARKVYLKLERSQRQTDGHTAKSERHRQYYARLLEGDRYLQERYDESLTTAMLTRRLSPLDEADKWLTPWECDGMLHGGSITRSVRNAFDYHLGAFEFEWVAVTSGTRTAATPHEHLYFWINDSDNNMKPDHLKPALERHLKHCANAYRDDHSYRPDGTDGAITVQHNPDCVDHTHDELMRIISGNTPAYPNTQAAQYLASQLPHLPASDTMDPNKPNPSDAAIDGGVAAWLSSHQWFRQSGGFPA